MLIHGFISDKMEILIENFDEKTKFLWDLFLLLKKYKQKLYFMLRIILLHKRLKLLSKEDLNYENKN